MTDLPATKVSLSFSCRNLPKLDIRSKSDPMVVVFTKNEHTKGSDWVEVGRTEMIVDNHDPDFTTLILIDYKFEEVQPLRFVCVDVDNPKTTSLKEQDLVGTFETRLANIVTAAGQELTGPLKKGSTGRGVITIRSEEVIMQKQTLHLHLAAEKLDKKDFFGKSDPFLKFFRARENGTWEAVHSTEIIKQNLNPVWKKFSIPIWKLCNGDYDRPVMIECHDWDSDGSTDFIGKTQISVRSLLGEQRAFVLRNEKKTKNDGIAGTLKILDAHVVQEYSFLDYIAGGCSVSLITAIDFTASNGNPRDPNSLHFTGNFPNQYEQAIQGVGSVVAPYDTDGIIPTFGFGAKWAGQVHHCFPLVAEGCNGVSGILEAYRNCVSNVELYGPTIFRQVIQMAAQQAAQGSTQQNQNYTILLILTDGVITDMEPTMEELITVSGLPLSIIIVGIGKADFSDMNRLDSDDKLLKYGGRVAQRDIVQFVPFRDFVNQPPEALAKHTLAEVPGQFMAYMKSRGIVPNPPRQHQ